MPARWHRARHLAVSGSPVREAVLQLVGQGLAVEQPRKGVVVATVDHDDLVRIHEIRAYLEAASARYCAERIERAAVAQLDAVLARQKQAVADADALAYYETNAELHRLIAGPCRQSAPRTDAGTSGGTDGNRAPVHLHEPRPYACGLSGARRDRLPDPRQGRSQCRAAMRSQIAATLARVTKQRG